MFSELPKLFDRDFVIAYFLLKEIAMCITVDFDPAKGNPSFTLVVNGSIVADQSNFSPTSTGLEFDWVQTGPADLILDYGGAFPGETLCYLVSVSGTGIQWAQRCGQRGDLPHIFSLSDPGGDPTTNRGGNWK